MKYQALWHRAHDVDDFGGYTIHNHTVGPVRQIGREPFQTAAATIGTKAPLQACQEEAMINTVKRGSEIQETECPHLSLIHGQQKVIE